MCVAERRGLDGHYATVLIVAGCSATVHGQTAGVSGQAATVVGGQAAIVIGGRAAIVVGGLSCCHLNGQAASANVQIVAGHSATLGILYEK